MVNNLGGTYTTGTISIDALGTTFVGTGTLWTIAAEQGDWILANGAIAVITDDITDTTLESELEWSGGALTNAPYVLLKMSWLRYEPAILQQKVREFIAAISQAGLLIYVTGDEPDPGIGSDGQFAIKVNTTPWRVWYKVSGEWVLQGSPVGFAWRGLWDIGEDYVINDQVHRAGNAYVSLTINTGSDPISNPDDWDLYLSGGTRYDILWWDNGRPIDGELLWVAPLPVAAQFPGNMLGSQGKSGDAATASSVFSLRKNNVEFATMTFAIGATTATFAGTQTTFAIGDEFSVVAPASQDATLARVRAAFTAYR